MKILRWILPVGISLLAPGPALEAGEAVAAPPQTEVQQELSRLIRADAAKVAATETRKPAEPTAAGNEPVLVLDPVEVTTPRLPDLSPPPREDRVKKFFRTGTLLEFGPEKRRVRLWMKGDKGLMLTFPF